ncbi:hypothetical protein TKK_0018338 [Trichogramma kaykai]
MCYNENYNGETINETSETKNLQYLRCLQENTIYTLEQREEIHESQPNHEIEAEFECKDFQFHVNSLVSDKLNEEFYHHQPNHEIKAEFECEDVKPNLNLLVSDKVDEEAHTFQPDHEIKIEFECKNETPNRLRAW